MACFIRYSGQLTNRSSISSRSKSFISSLQLPVPGITTLQKPKTLISLAWFVCWRVTLIYIVTWLSITIDGFWIDDRIYRTLRYCAWIPFIVQCYTHTLNVHSHVFITNRCLVAASKGGRSPSSRFQLSPCLSNISQRLYRNSSLTHSLANHLLFTSFNSAPPRSAYNISARTS
jgi:hypothetical protein